MTDDDIKALALAAGIREVAMQDVLLQFPNDGAQSFAAWLASVKAERPHWFDIVTDGTEAALFSLKAQGEHVKANGEAATRELLAKHGLKLGQVKSPATDDDTTIKGAANPFSKAYRGPPDEREARIASIIKSGGTRLAASLAKSAGVSITGQPLQTVEGRR
jgi:hypothetical protein